jgi:hypothetical protein
VLALEREKAVRNAPKRFTPRKLLVAAVGVATLSYVAGCKEQQPPTSGNLPAPPPSSVLDADASSPAVDSGSPFEPPPTSGNLPAPQPPQPIEGVDAGSTP